MNGTEGQKVKNIVQQRRKRRGRGRPLKNVEGLGYRIPVEIHADLKQIVEENKELLESKTFLITCILANGVEQSKNAKNLVGIVEKAEVYFRRQRAIKFMSVKKRRKNGGVK